jgi:hypothetical protein
MADYSEFDGLVAPFDGSWDWLIPHAVAQCAMLVDMLADWHAPALDLSTSGSLSLNKVALHIEAKPLPFLLDRNCFRHV